MNKVCLSGWRWLWISVLVVVGDQLSKLAIAKVFFLGESKPLLPFLNFTLAHNYGAAFSLLSTAGGWQQWLFTIISLGISTGIVVWLYRLPGRPAWLCVGLTLILGGALGNVIDRFRYGYVIDFIHFHIAQWSYPIFNVADSCVCVGAGIVLIYSFSAEK